MNQLINIIKEEITNFLFEGYDNNSLTVDDVSIIAAKATGYGDQPRMLDAFKKMFRNAYRDGGDENVINTFKDATGVQLFNSREGRYSFQQQITPQDYNWKE